MNLLNLQANWGVVSQLIGGIEGSASIIHRITHARFCLRDPTWHNARIWHNFKTIIYDWLASWMISAKPRKEKARL